MLEQLNNGSRQINLLVAMMNDDPVPFSELLRNLQIAYDRAAQERNSRGKAQWKEDVRDHFRAIIQAEGCRTLLEIGSGTGADAEFFQGNGYQVICADLSLANARFCKEKGLNACVFELTRPCFMQERFDAVYSVNCLLHIPKAVLPSALESIRRLLIPNGLFYLGQYGGRSFEGVVQEDHYQPKRFYSLHPDDELKRMVVRDFQLLEFERILLSDDPDHHYQSVVLRRR